MKPVLRRDDMDVAGYERGVLKLPTRLRLHAQISPAVEIGLNQEQAILLAEDLERGISIRGGNMLPDGRLSLPDRMRLHARFNDFVVMHLTAHEARLLSDDLDCGIRARSGPDLEP